MRSTVSYEVGRYYKMSVLGLETLQSDFRFVLYGAEFASESEVGRKYRAVENECVSVCCSESYVTRHFFGAPKVLFLHPKSPETAKKFAKTDTPERSNGVSVRP